jgi:hypothetical protein
MTSLRYPGRQVRELRVPLPQWRWPRRDHLLEQVYRRGPPPFNPFPSVQDIVDAALCPYAVFHKFYHGYHGALIGLRGDEGEGIQLGHHFHNFISFLKTEIIAGRARPDDAQSLLGRYCSSQHVDVDTENSLRSYLRYWLRRKRESLEQLRSQMPRVFFEVHVASINVTFARGVRFPLSGIIDEIDTTNRKIIERTLRGREDDVEPPFLKDFQLWLLWKIISSIDGDAIREVLGCIDLRDYELIVETPYRDFRIDKNNPQFNEWAEDAFSWINDLATGNHSRLAIAISEAWRNRGFYNRPCRYGEEIEECMMRNACYYRRRRYPERRSALRSDLRRLYYALFNEQIWKHDLILYQLAYMEQCPDIALRNELRRLLVGKSIFPVRVIEPLNGENFVLRIDEHLRGPLSEVIQDEVVNLDIVFGSFSVGLRRRAHLDIDNPRSNIRNGQIVVSVEGPINVEGLNALLIRDSLLLREEPWFLKRLVQRSLFYLEKWGLDRDDRARAHVTIRFIDTLFGSGRFRARVEDHEPH